MDPSDTNSSSKRSQTHDSSELEPRSQPAACSPKSYPPPPLQKSRSCSPRFTTGAMQNHPKDTMETVRVVLGRWRQMVGETTKKAEDIAGNVWQHFKTGPSITDVAMGRIAQGTKVLAEGGYEKIFRQTFETTPHEQLMRSFACYLSTSAGPVIGILYRSTAKLAFCSDNPLPYKAGGNKEWSYYKVIVPLPQLKAIISSTNDENPSVKYIQVISADSHEFWFMGFVNYEGAVTHLQQALQGRVLQAARNLSL